LDKWESIADRKIREAIEAGEFDNLPSKGKPIELDIDPDPTLWMAHHLLRVNGFAPSWIEESKDIDAAIHRFRADLRKTRRTSAAVPSNIVSGVQPIVVTAGSGASVAANLTVMP
jgi:hypothetical protein